MGVVSNQITDLNCIWEGEIVTILGVDEIVRNEENFVSPYICVLRHQDQRIFELVKSPSDDRLDSVRLVLSQRKSDFNFNKFKVYTAFESSYQGWHYRDILGKEREISHSF